MPTTPIVTITPEQIEKLESHRKEMQTAMVELLVSVLEQNADNSTYTDDGVDEIHVTRPDGLIMRVRVHVDYLPYNPLKMNGSS